MGASAPLMLIVIARFLTPIEQGFYYAFTSILGLQVVFELGLGVVVVQTVSHMAAELDFSQEEISGPPRVIGRLGKFLTDLIRWYIIITILFFIIVGIGGSIFLNSSNANSEIKWMCPWWLTIAAFSLTIAGNALLNFIEGIGCIADVASIRFWQALFGTIALLALFTFGAKLYAIAAPQIINVIGIVFIISKKYRKTIKILIASRSESDAINWKSDIWPFQWRIAGSWIAGYFRSNAITLVLFKEMDPISAGKFGFTLAALSAIASTALAWISTKASIFGRLAANGSLDKLDLMFIKAKRATLFIAVIGCVVLVVCVYLLKNTYPSLSQRFVDLNDLVLLCVAMLINVQITAQATYVRAFKKEPYTIMSITIAVIQFGLVSFVSAQTSLSLVVCYYSVISILVSFLWANKIFLQFKNGLREKSK
jgi:hypothetical protein